MKKLLLTFALLGISAAISAAKIKVHNATKESVEINNTTIDPDKEINVDGLGETFDLTADGKTCKSFLVFPDQRYSIKNENGVLINTNNGQQKCEIPEVSIILNVGQGLPDACTGNKYTAIGKGVNGDLSKDKPEIKVFSRNVGPLTVTNNGRDPRAPNSTSVTSSKEQNYKKLYVISCSPLSISAF